MRTLIVLDDRNYDPSWPSIARYCVRAAVLQDGLVALLRSAKAGFFKFPGGGIDSGESHQDTLIRETREEAGLTIRPGSEKELGLVLERRRSMYCDEVFEQYSYYYLADVLPGRVEQQLEQHEKELGYELVWVDPRDAYEVDMTYAQTHPRARYLYREAYVLGKLAGIL